jgi:heme-degrading monooxygenase HmoA
VDAERLVTPSPPYWAVVFTSKRRTAPDDGYDEMAVRMDALVHTQEGFLGHESVRDAEGVGITVSYWRDQAAIAAWKRVDEHREGQRQGQLRWYESYVVRVAKVEREYQFPPAPKPPP